MRILTKAVAAALLFALALVAYASLYDRGAGIVTFLDRSGRVIGSVDASHRGTRCWTPLSEIPQSIIEKTIRAEDRFFFWHRGINPFSVAKAALHDLVRARALRGGSTITQQLAKHLIQAREGRLLQRTAANKLREALLAAALEVKHSKQWILERYLNTVYYGARAYGVAAAADANFGKRLSELSDSEEDFLVRLPRSPRMAGSLSAAPPSEEAHLGRHFIEYAYARLRERGVGGQAEVRTTLDLELQGQVERALATILAVRAASDPEVTAAAVVIDVASGGLLAMAGSRDYFDDAIDGQVNAAVASRQPGSALKPFTYFAAFSRGFTPDTIVPDEPMSFMAPGAEESDAYSPQNFDHRYHGEMSMREALANSYNVPAVATLNEIGLSYYHELLRRFGLTTLTMPPSHYGLAVTLGSGEVTLVALTNAYAALARNGASLPLAIFEGNAASAPLPVVAHAARFANEVTSILIDPLARRKAFGFNEAMEIEGHDVAIKTGTSFDQRDCWAMGYTPSYAVGVWVGHADGSPLESGLRSTGATAAAPIWHAIMETLLRGKAPETFPEPSGEDAGVRVTSRDEELPSVLHAGPRTFHITSPASNAVFRIHPYLPRETQMIRAEAETKSEEELDLQWSLDGEHIEATQGKKSEAWIEPEVGKHRLRVESQRGQAEELCFKVIDERDY